MSEKKKASSEKQAPVRRLLTEEEKFERDRRKAQAIRRKRQKRERALATVVLLAAVYIGIIGIIAGYGILSFTSAPKSDRVYSLQGYIGEEKVFTLSSAEATKTHGVYIPFSVLKKLTPFSVAGDEQKVSVILPDSGDYIKCFPSSSSVLVNDTPCRLSAPVVFEGDDWLLPVEMLEYINGITVTYQADGICKISIAEKDARLSASHALPVGIDNINYSPLYNQNDVSDTSDTSTPDQGGNIQ